MTRKIRNVKQLQKKRKMHQVERVGVNSYHVTSGTSGKVYKVTVQNQARDGAVRYGGAFCSCKWGQYRPGSDGRSGCSHVMAVFEALDAERKTSAWGSSQDAKRQHRPITVIGDGVILTSRKVPG